MTLKNTDHSYGNIAKAFHWIMFLILSGLVIVGYYMSGLPTDSPAEVADKLALYDWHRSFGIVILFLVVLRLGWRLVNPVPKMPDSMSRIESFTAHAMHILLYLLMFAQPLSGWLMTSYSGRVVKFFGLEFPGLADKDKVMADFFHESHEIMAVLLIILFVVHVAAALFHHFIRKDDIMRRMSPHPSKPE